MSVSSNPNAPLNNYLATLAEDFDKIRMRYLDEFATIGDISKCYNPSDKLNNYFQKSEEGHSRLNSKIVDYWEGKRELVKEIKGNKLAGNEGYFEYFKEVFSVQYGFFENQFPDVLTEYLEDQTRGYDLIEKLFRQEIRVSLSPIEYLRAIQFELIMIFAFMEDLYHRENKSYDALIFGESYDLNRPSKHNYIRLLYGAVTNKIIVDKIHDKLNGNYFHQTKIEFRKHFNSPQKFKPITWRGTQTALVLLFNGRNQPYIKGLKTLNSNKARIIVDHFVKIDGEEFNEHSLGSVPQNIQTYQKSKDAELIIELLEEINELIASKKQ
jgi:hypothetical protein